MDDGTAGLLALGWIAAWNVHDLDRLAASGRIPVR
jgi:hypothetical protein